MNQVSETPAQQAMRLAYKLANVKQRRMMAPLVHQWASAMQRGIAESYYSGVWHGR